MQHSDSRFVYRSQFAVKVSGRSKFSVRAWGHSPTMILILCNTVTGDFFIGHSLQSRSMIGQSSMLGHEVIAQQWFWYYATQRQQLEGLVFTDGLGMRDRIGDPESLKMDVAFCESLPGITWKHCMCYIGTDCLGTLLSQHL